MFDIGMTELLVVAVVAIIVVGPKDLPGLLRNLAKYMGQIRNLARDFRSQMDDAIREADMADLKKMNPLDDIKSDMNDYMNSARAFDEPDEEYVAEGDKMAKGEAIDAGVPANDTPKSTKSAKSDDNSTKPEAAEAASKAS